MGKQSFIFVKLEKEKKFLEIFVLFSLEDFFVEAQTNKRFDWSIISTNEKLFFLLVYSIELEESQRMFEQMFQTELKS